MTKPIPVILSVCLFAVNCSAASGKAQIARFEPWLATIEASLTSSKDTDDVANTLLSGTNRVAAFSLQALGRLYKDNDQGFKDMRSTFKDLEDAIGEYNKWNDIYTKGLKKGLPEAELKKLLAKRDSARASFVGFLQNKNYFSTTQSPIERTRAFLKSYKWSSYKEDRDNVLGQVRSELKSIRKTAWDLSRLEEGDGLHELRRELRWFLLEARSLNGLITYDESVDCPVAEYEQLLNEPVATSKYAELPVATTEKEPCLISQCLYLGVTQAVEDLGKLKDKAELINNTTNPADPDLVPEEIRVEAAAVLQNMESTDLLKELQDEIKSCTEGN